LDLAIEIGGESASSVTPMIFRPMRMEDRVIQLRAAPFDTWDSVHGLALLDGDWPGTGDEVAITEGIAIATGWGVGTRAEIFGTDFTVTALVRAPGTKFASVWMRFERADALFEGQSGYQMITVVPAPGADPRTLLADLEEVAGGRYSVYFESELIAEQGAREGAADNLAAVSTLIGIAALVFGGFNLSAVALAERRTDLGIARSIGFGRRGIGGFAVLRALLLAAGGFALGALVAVIVLTATASTTVRSFVFTPDLPIAAWVVGAGLSALAAVIGTAVAVRSAAAIPVRQLVEPR
ncbi:MAG TPA: FtsX-like permease family protein, partial [Acidimicrobiia bacterium]|nr:FtsX-like permease family protein [Acidimicrobiia bacterium]